MSEEPQQQSELNDSDEKRRKLVIALITIGIVFVAIAFPTAYFISESPPAPKPEVAPLPQTTGVAKIIIPAAEIPRYDARAIAAKLTEQLQAPNPNLTEIKRLSRNLAGAGEGSAPLMVTLLQLWNHPTLFETVTLLGPRGLNSIPHIESLLDYLDTTCSDDRLASLEPGSPIESLKWLNSHVRCTDQDLLRRSAQDAWIALKQYEVSFVLREWSGNTEELNRALVNAVERERLANVKQLLGYGAYVNAAGRSTDGNHVLTPMMAAMGNDSSSILDLLIQVGASPDFRVWYPLNEAIRLKRRDRIEFLLSKGVALNRQDGTGQYPLTLATEMGDIDLVKLLLKHGANPYLRNHTGKSAREIALPQPKSELYAVIAEAIDTGDVSLQSTPQH